MRKLWSTFLPALFCHSMSAQIQNNSFVAGLGALVGYEPLDHSAFNAALDRVRLHKNKEFDLCAGGAMFFSGKHTLFRIGYCFNAATEKTDSSLATDRRMVADLAIGCPIIRNGHWLVAPLLSLHWNSFHYHHVIDPKDNRFTAALSKTTPNIDITFNAADPGIGVFICYVGGGIDRSGNQFCITFNAGVLPGIDRGTWTENNSDKQLAQGPSLDRIAYVNAGFSFFLSSPPATEQFNNDRY